MKQTLTEIDQDVHASNSHWSYQSHEQRDETNFNNS